MTRLAVLAFTLGALPWTGESFVATNIASTTTTECNLPQPPTRSLQRSRGRPHTRRQRQRRCQQPTQEPSTSAPFSSCAVSSVISYRRSPSLLHAALLQDPPSSGPSKRGRNPTGTVQKVPGWRRRIFRKIPWRRQSQVRPMGSKSSSSLPSSPIQHEEQTIGAVESYAVYNQGHHGSDDFLKRNFDLLDPDTVLPVVQVDQKHLSPSSRSSSIKVNRKESRPSKVPTIDSEYFDVSITPAASDKGTSNSSESDATSTSNTNTKKGLICRLLENILTEKIGQRWTTETPDGLKVDVRSSPDNYNKIGRLLFKGLFRADATLSSDRIVFPMIRFSSVRIEMEQVTLNLMGFFLSKNNNGDDGNSNNDGNQGNQKHKNQWQKNRQENQHKTRRRGNTASDSVSAKTTGKVRYPKQFDLHIEDLTMSRHDLLFSPCIKNGLRQLLVNVLKDRGVRSDSIKITSIDILPNGKISCAGEAKTHFASAPPVHFEVRSGIAPSNRGHVLTFPGLEVSLNRDIGLFVPVHPTLDLDVGHNTKFNNIVIDGRQKALKIAASVTITPDRTRLMQDYVQTSDAFSAIFFYDVGQWLTKLGRFTR